MANIFGGGSSVPPTPLFAPPGPYPLTFPFGPPAPPPVDLFGAASPVSNGIFGTAPPPVRSFRDPGRPPPRVVPVPYNDPWITVGNPGIVPPRAHPGGRSDSEVLIDVDSLSGDGRFGARFELQNIAHTVGTRPRSMAETLRPILMHNSAGVLTPLPNHSHVVIRNRVPHQLFASLMRGIFQSPNYLRGTTLLSDLTTATDVEMTINHSTPITTYTTLVPVIVVTNTGTETLPAGSVFDDHEVRVFTDMALTVNWVDTQTHFLNEDFTGTIDLQSVRLY